MVRDRPPPTGYIDEGGTFHPGPGSDGHLAHLSACWSCCRGVIRAREDGEAWAIGTRLPRKLPPIPMPIPGPGMQREQHALVTLRPQHIGPCAVAVGAVSYALTSLAWWLAVPLLVALVVVGRSDWLAIDRTPQARLLRR